MIALAQNPARNTGVISVAGDFAGLRIATCELFEEEMFAEDDARLVKRADVAANAEAILKSIPVRRTLSPGYYDRANYLLDLDLMFELGIRFDTTQLLKDEVRGLKAVRLGKQDFERDHPRCVRCGEYQKTLGGAKCSRCGHEFGKRAA